MSNEQQNPEDITPLSKAASAPNVVLDLDPVEDVMAETVEQIENDEKLTAAIDAAPKTMSSDDRIAAALEAMLSISKNLSAQEERREATRQLGVHEVDPVSPWNPEGKRVRKTFRRNTFMHGIALNPNTHTEEDIELFNKLKPGRYLGRRVEVQRDAQGGINLTWAGKALDQRMQMYSEFPTTNAMLKAIVAERALKEEQRRLGRFEDDDDDVI